MQPAEADARERVLAATSAYGRLDEIAAEPHERRGILNSEMAAVIATSLAMKVEVFVESGRARGHSTLLLAKHLGPADVAIHSFDRARDEDALYAEKKLAGLANLHLHYGDSRLIIPQFIAGLGAKRVGVLIDGPKDKKALDLLSDCLIASSTIIVAFVHDLPRKSGKPSEGRYYAERYFQQPFFTDDSEFVRRFAFLDGVAGPQSGSPLPHHDEDLADTSYGPTLGVFIPTAFDRDEALQRGPRSTGMRRTYWALKDRLRRRRASAAA